MNASLSFLFVTWNGGGNVPPVLGLAARLIKRGHRVRILTEPCLKEAVLKIGADYVAFDQHFTRTDASIDLIQDWNAKPLTIPSVDNILVRPAFDVAKETQSLLVEQHCDVLVADFMMLGALMAAEALGIKRVALFHMPEYLPGPGRPPGGLGLLPSNTPLGRIRDAILTRVFNKVINQYLPALNRAREALSLSALEAFTDIFHQADLRLIQTSKAFDAPIDPAPENVRYVGPVLDDPSWPDSPIALWPEADKRPLLVVSLSTTFQNQQNALENIIQSVSSLDVRCLVTLGPAITKDAFILPDNVIALEGVPHSQVFPMASAVITHAGHGTVMRALAHGLPLVCLPMGRDQLDNATLVAYHGAGLRLSQKAGVRTIRRAICQVLEDTRFKENAGVLQVKIQKEASAFTAEMCLENLAAQGDRNE
ncbi:MAG: glycosyltransferase [Oleiphilus sp.]